MARSICLRILNRKKPSPPIANRRNLSVVQLNRLYSSAKTAHHYIIEILTKGEKMKTPIDIGISEQNRIQIAKGLSHLLADTYTLYLKTHNYHWNVVGPQFQTLHLMFETQYNELAQAVDGIAERIRALGVKAPGSYVEFAKLTSIKETSGDLSANEMIKELVLGQEAVVKTARNIFHIVNEAHDEPTADLLTERMQTHEKVAWMLRSMLE